MRRSHLNSDHPKGRLVITDPSEPDAWVAKIEPDGRRFRIWLEGGLMCSGSWWARTEDRARRIATRKLDAKRAELRADKASHAAQITIR